MINVQRNRTALCAGALLAGALLLPRAASAGGYIISEMDSAMAGRGGAAAAVQDSPSAVFFNPANITALDGLQARVGMSLIFPAFKYQPQDSRGSEAGTVTTPVYPPSVSLTYKLGNLGFGDLAAGFGFYVPYGSTMGWPGDWDGRAEIQDISLRVFEISPVIALKPNETFSIGVGLRILPGEVYMKRAVGFGSMAEGDVAMAGSATEVGFSAGVSIWGFENLTLALTWRSPVIMRFTGTGDFDFPAPFDTEARDSNMRVRLKLPQVFRLGAAYEIIQDTLNVSADLQFQQWSAYRILKINFEDDDGNDWKTEIAERNSEDSITFSAGVEWVIFEGLAVRAGYAFDERTLPEESVNPAPPDSDRHVLALGASYTWDKWLSFHAHFSNAFFVTRESNTASFPGTWSGGHPADTMAYIFGLSVGVNFDVSPLFTHEAAPATGGPAAEAQPQPANTEGE